MEIDDGKIEFSKNKTLLFTQYRNYFYFCVLTAVTDAISTTYFMSLLGPEPETNIIVRDLAYYYGIYAGPVLGKIYQLFAVWGLSVIAPRLTRFICIVIIFVNLIATFLNISVFVRAYNESIS